MDIADSFVAKLYMASFRLLRWRNLRDFMYEPLQKRGKQWTSAADNFLKSARAVWREQQ